jgi:hypothetical protein
VGATSARMTSSDFSPCYFVFDTHLVSLAANVHIYFMLDKSHNCLIPVAAMVTSIRYGSDPLSYRILRKAIVGITSVHSQTSSGLYHRREPRRTKDFFFFFHKKEDGPDYFP